MPFDVKALMHNKPALAGLGVAAAAGLYVLVKRKQTTGSSAASGAGTAGGQTQYAVPSSYPDTTGTNLVQQWGQFSQNLLGDLQNNFPGAGNGTGQIQNSLTVPQGTYLYQWLAQQQASNPGFNFEALRALNPGIDANINWYDPGSPGNVDGSNYTPYLNQQTTIRVR